MVADKKDDGAVQTDKRITWMEQRIICALKIKTLEMKKFLDNDDVRAQFNDFLDTPDCHQLFIVQTPGQPLQARVSPPEEFKKKTVYFLKKSAREKLTPETISKAVLVGDLSPNCLESLSLLAKEVYLQFFGNTEGLSHKGSQIPEVVSKEIMERYQTFLAKIHVMIGLTKGKTLLPLPQLNNKDKKMDSKDVVHSLESAVVQWTNQIKNVLKTDPEHLLNSGKHPGPLVEIEFWRNKSSNLENLEEQLHSSKVLKVLKVLQSTQSSYFPSFSALMQDVQHSAVEANEITRFLQPITPYFESMCAKSSNKMEFDELANQSVFRKIFHLIYMVWNNSTYYNTPTRLVVLIREICNDLILMAKHNVNIDDLFQIEPEEAVQRLSKTLSICGHFKNCYFHYKAKAAKDSSTPWRFQNTALFSRLDSFLERCHDILDLLETVILFSRLEKIEIGGTKGKQLSTDVQEIHKEFHHAFEKVRRLEYDLLDVDEPQFDNDFSDFRCTIKELERRLGSILTQAFDDAGAIYSAFKVVDSFEGILDRPVIQQEWLKKQGELIKAYATDLQIVQEIFQQFKDNPAVYSSMPPTACGLVWCRGLIERVSEPLAKLTQLNRSVLETQDAKETMILSDSLLKLLQDYCKGKYDTWASQVGNVSIEKLKQNLLRRDDTSRKLFVNFDPQLVRLLREVNYIEKLNSYDGVEEGSQWVIPQQALALNKNSETFRSHILSLELIVTTYNGIITTLLDVEAPMIAQELDKINQELEVGLKLLDWNSHDKIDEFIASTMHSVTSLDSVLKTLKNNVKVIQDSLTKFEEENKFFPFTAKDGGKTLSPDEFNRKYTDHHNQQKQDLSKRGHDIHAKLQSSFEVLNEIKSTHEFEPLTQESEAWVNYVLYVNDIVTKGILLSITTSLNHLLHQVDSEWLTNNDGIPLLDIKLSLVPKETTYEARFQPPLHSKEGAHSLQASVNGWIQDYLNLSTCITRVDTGEDNYLPDAESSDEIQDLIAKVNNLIGENAEECRAFQSPFANFSYLWTKDIKKSFTEFLKPKKHMVETEDGEGEREMVDESADEFFGVKLELFEHQITVYAKIYQEIIDLPPSASIGWLRVDAKPMKEAIKAICDKWKASFTGYLQDKVETTLEDLFHFIEEVNSGLEQPVEDGDMATLKQVMGHIRDCKRRHQQTQDMMEPINQVMTMLRQHEAISPADIERLEEQRKAAPEAWNQTYKKSLNVRESLSNRQDAEAKKIKDDTVKFEEKVKAFRTTFQTIPPYGYDITSEQAYIELDKWDNNLGRIEKEAVDLRELQELFDLNPSEFKGLKDCRSDLRMLKQIWDMIAHVKSQFVDWMKTTFKMVKVDFFLDETKKLQKQLKGFSVRMKGWDCYKGLDTTVKNMATSLPLVQDLRSPAMRDRHWRQLLKTTKQSVQIDPESDTFTLQQLLDLGLHAYVEDVGNIVEKAVKELAIEKKLKKIVEIWDDKEFTYARNEQLDVYVLGTIDEIVEVLEEHNTALQTMQANRFVEYFIEQVNKWQRALGLVDSLMIRWMEVQKQWSNLYPIFMLSEDIKTQLPEDAKNFATVDELFRAMMSKAKNYTNIIELCTTDVLRKAMGRQDNMEGMLTLMQNTLEGCEKALADYLETKRKIFPRFYFVSSADLVDILSKGSDPSAVMVHISKIIDAVDTFSFKGDSKVVTQITSRESEEVQLCREYNCEGAVEEWLNGILEVTWDTVKSQIADGHATYVEQSRTSWIFQYPAQIVCYVTRTWFTMETHTAFDQLEDGNEAAIKDFLKQQKSQLDALISLVLGELSKGDRKKLVTLITIDVHARDVVAKMVEDKVDTSASFQWQSQLRYYWEDSKGSVIRICDAEFINGYEYIGNCGCLVITPLTDRCYITLTQAVRLFKGGAPAGPAGTGKTETTKDLSRALGLACYVFNCSDQMDYKSLGNIFKGLAMSGSWGCFDEFNRIPIEVLSVVATQVKSILDAIKNAKKRFRFMSEEIPLKPSCGAWITMNPGYKGRTELPENIKSLFRPCAMVVPDLMNICEIMLSAEGFLEAKDLAKKFVTLYRLNKELLSAQDHYDWGLRAVKSVLVIAGELKRGEPNIDERRTLMRALRDTNMAKLSKDDIYVFMKLIQALFPNMEIPAKQYPTLVDACKKAAAEYGYLPGENDIFITKAVQYKELLDVRHSVFIIGTAGSAKTALWKTLASAFGHLGDKTVTEIINPKAITSNELYGYIHETSREWKDGLLSRIFRDLAQLSKTKKNSKWIILDGIIDAEWIESMNTVMDDNRMLTLASNERIPLTSSMRLVFEISHLKNATPATVSRAGIIFLNETDVGWSPFKDQWVASRREAKERNYLDMLFDKYVPSVFEYFKKVMKPIVPCMDINIVMTLCNLLAGLLTETNVPPGSSSDLYERYFVFCAIWAFGGPLPSDGRTDYRLAFSNWWKKEFNTIRIAETGSVFDYFLDANTKEYIPWTSMVPKYKHNREALFASITVETADTVRLTYLMDLLLAHSKPVLFIGTAGTGKTNIVKARLDKLDSSDIIYRIINFNSRTDSRSLQGIMESSLDKKSGRQFGPPGRKKLIFFIDDINMPTPDKYGTQDAIALLRMHFDYGFWYDRNKMTLKDVVNVQYLSAMNPKAGAFNILDRLQRHYGVFACNMPEKGDLQLIYNQILVGHFGPPFDRDFMHLASNLTNATIDLHRQVSKLFLPTAIKFHYQWNLREMSNIVQGLLQAQPGLHEIGTVIRLWLHECARTFADRMVTEDDLAIYTEQATAICKSSFGELLTEETFLAPNLFGPFFGEELTYDQIQSYESLHKFLSNKLNEYNSDFAAMNLVLFNQAMEHVCRISRIVSNPRGNALLVGVGGSGKQSLARLSAFIVNLDIFQIQVSSTYGLPEFKTDMMELYKKCGQKGSTYAFVITDSQIVDKQMLVYLNDMLASGNVPDLFAPDEREGIEGAMVSEVKASGHPDYGNRDVCWDFFIQKVRNNLHVVLCFSPVGEQFRSWCRQFPALANTTVIDWFHPWPHQALVSVAHRFLTDDKTAAAEFIPHIAEHMAFCHELVNDTCAVFKQVEKRAVYTTPKSFLELISLYKHMLKLKTKELNEKVERLVTGLQKLNEASEQVSALKVVLEKEQVVVAEKAESTDQLLAHVGKEKVIVQEQSDIAQVEEEKTNKIVQEVDANAKECQADLAAAKPIVDAALQALDQLDKAALTELKSMAKPPDDVVMVTSAVMILTADPKKIPKDRSWAAAKKMMANITQWLKELLNFDQNNIPQICVDTVEPVLKHPSFHQEVIITKSFAASSLCAWVINMVKYHRIRCEVRPKEERLAEAQDRLAASKTALKKVQDRVNELRNKLDSLIKQYEEARDEKQRIEEKAQRTQEKLNLAERLVNGLADEKVRWAETIQSLKERTKLLAGDVLLASAFISYIGPFSRSFRDDLVKNQWTEDIKQRNIPMTDNLDPVLGVMTNEAEVAGWNNEGLPADRVSTENGAIVTNCTRYPLMIDPQLQGVKWIKSREEKNGLRVLQISQKNYLSELITCLEQGLPCLIEALPEAIDPVIEPVLSKSVIKKGSMLYIRLGDKDVEFNPKFTLYLQTKLGNPHYKPEIAAQTTLMNFMVTEDGLEDQLLATVVNMERPDLEEQRVALLREMNQMKIDLQQCEDGLLYELSNATGDILENVTLIENLENTKKKAQMINKSMAAAKKTTATIAKNRLTYSPVAERGSLLFFQIDQLAKIDHMYQFSLEAFEVVFNKALSKAKTADTVDDRVSNIMDSITETIFAFTSRGLFEKHKLIFSTLLCLAILKKRGDLEITQLAYLIRGPRKFGIDRPDSIAEWCPDPIWAAVQSLAEVQGASPSFEILPTDMAEHNRWKLWCETEKPEEEKMPTDWKTLTSFQKLLVLRALRPDRLTAALENFIAENIGKKYVSDQAVSLDVSFEDSTPTTPVFFILSPGVDPVKNVESLGAKLGFTEDENKFFNVSLGQGQEPVAENALEYCFENGGWAMLNNIHLTAKWLLRLEKMLERYSVIYTKMALIARRRAEKRIKRRKSTILLDEDEDEAKGDQEAGENGEEEGEEKEEGEDGGAGKDGPGEGEQDKEAEKVAEAADGTAAEGEGEGEESATQQSQHLTAEEDEGDEEVEEEDDEDDDDPELQMEGPKGHPDFRVFLSAEPSNAIPIGILQRSIKLTNEPPQGLKANLVRAFVNFGDEPWENSSKQQEFKCILFSLCFFHAVVVERKKFGAQGWNRSYPFNPGDLTTCVDVLANYLEDRPKIPWDDLRYVFGEIMYGGHITDDWDRVLCRGYLAGLITPDVLEGVDLCPQFPSPPPLSYKDYLNYVEENCPPESPVSYGLHPNAEINFRTVQGDTLFRIINELQSSSGSGGATNASEKVRQSLDEIMGSLPEEFNLQEIAERLEDDRTPGQHVFYQECERLNILVSRMKKSLTDLDLGLKGALSMSPAMQILFDEIYLDKVPESWADVGYMSIRPLGSWFQNLLERNQQLLDFTTELQLPKVVYISYFFNPNSFLTAVMQTTAMQYNYDLDQMTLVTEVTKKWPDQVDAPAREGAHVFGMFMEGARWDMGASTIEDSRMKELYPKMPVMTIKSLPVGKVDFKDQYACPVYKTQERGPGFVTRLHLKTKYVPRKWVIGGVALLLDVVE